ncbi:SHOCT domain-containing protein [Angustibacter sp. McL0619]|uniref:SHOCT domain-containing protein n=1 Tax=Angustibacter sp. McL0619 TaxID=3415676 RepID=UPI003CEAAD3A
MSFWDVVWFIIISFAFIAYLMVLFAIITDLFRDRDTSGIVKAIWIVLLIVLPLLTSLVYLIARGGGMAERQASAVKGAVAQQDAYIKSVAGSGASPAEQIKHAKELLDSGAINQSEFDSLKAKALA